MIKFSFMELIYLKKLAVDVLVPTEAEPQVDQKINSVSFLRVFSLLTIYDRPEVGSPLALLSFFWSFFVFLIESVLLRLCYYNLKSSIVEIGAFDVRAL